MVRWLYVVLSSFESFWVVLSGFGWFWLFFSGSGWCGGGFASESHGDQLRQVHTLWNPTRQLPTKASPDPLKNWQIHWNPTMHSENIQTHWNLSIPTEIYLDQLKHVHTHWNPSRPTETHPNLWTLWFWKGLNWSGCDFVCLDWLQWALTILRGPGWVLSSSGWFWVGLDGF